MTSSAGDIPGRAGRVQWIGLVVLMLAVGVSSIDLTVLHLAVPSLSRDLRPTSAQLLWIIDIYGFFEAGSLITMGTLGDRTGRRRTLMIGSAVFALVSIVAAFSASAGMLIAARALMGVAGATLVPSTLALIFTMFKDPPQRALAIGMWAAAFTLGSIVGPVVGGFLIERFWWGAAFLVAVPVMALLLVLGPRTLPEYRDPNAGRLDIRSAVFALVSVISCVYCLKESSQSGFGVLAAVSLVAGVGLGVLFVKRQSLVPHPLVDLRLFGAPRFSASLGAKAAASFIVVGFYLFVAQYLQLVVGLSAFEAGVWLLPAAIAYMLGSLLSPRLIHVMRPSVLIGVSMSLGALGLGLLAQVGEWGELSVVVASSVLVSFALSPVFNLTTELVVGGAPPESAGAASGVSETAVGLAGSLGVAVLGSIGAVAYRSLVSAAIPPDTAPEIVDAMKDTLGGAVEAVSGLRPDIANALLTAAQQAFTHALRVTAVASLAVAIVVGAMSAYYLRAVRLDHQPD